MTIGGWITMSVSMGAFALLFVWCMYKVLTSEKPNKKRNLKDK
jgi:hypothetical protein